MAIAVMTRPMAASHGGFAGYLCDGGTGTDTLMLDAGVTIPGNGSGLVSIEVTI